MAENGNGSNGKSSGSSDGSPPSESSDLLMPSKASANYEAIKTGADLERQIIEDLLRRQPQMVTTNWWAILLTVISGVSFTCSSALVKGLDMIDPMELLALRAIIQLIAIFPFIIYLRKNPFGPPGMRVYMFLQGIVGGLTLVTFFFATRELPLGDATTVMYSSPIFVVLMSSVFLKEACGFFRTFVIFLLMTGVILVLQPQIFFQEDAENWNVLGYTAAILCAFFTGINIVLMRKCKEVHFSFLVLHFSVWSLAMAIILDFTPGPWDLEGNLLDSDYIEWILATLAGVTGLFGQVFLTKALSMEGAGKVAVTRSLDIVLAFAVQVLYWEQIPGWMSILGAILVCISVAAIGTEEQINRFAATIP
ncbi:solute carrier family 35 member G1-like [Neocloeon triangulifer]|uniref:solute carrier family 35 member G1-like n=1 Tax=Neocloeon triangulifer TaxID=2078957 RepID=UPI00286F0997|nr:solute carrier family 35 member G1-like [Neocloeon triangulifer]